MPRKPTHDRDALIDIARDLFWRRGWAGTSLKDLERALDMRPGSFYAAFGSKDALYGLALDKYAAQGAERLHEAAAQMGPLAALAGHPAHVIAVPDDAMKACMLAKTLLELKPQDHDLAARADAHLAQMERVFATLFRAAQTAGEIGPQHDPDQLARRYQSDLLGLRVSAGRAGVNAAALAEDIAAGLRAL